MINNWGWQVQNKFENKTIKELIENKYLKFNSLKEKIILNNLEINIDFKYKLKLYDQIYILNKEILLKDFLKPNISKILYENQNFLIIYKGFGITVHPDSKHKTNTLLNLILEKLNFKNRDEILKKNLGIVHRLDKPTTGLIIIARNENSFNIFKKMMFERQIKRTYLAIVEGVPEKKYFSVDAPLVKPGKNKRSKVSFFGANAVTHFEFKEKNENKSLLKVSLETGRTHQIRAHLKFIGLPILNDSLYNLNKNEKFIYLHAFRLVFKLKFLKKEYNFKTLEPIYFKKLFK